MSLNDLITFFNKYINVQPFLIRIILALVIVLLGFLLRKTIIKWVIKVLRKITTKTKNNLGDLILTALEKPAQIFIFGLSVWMALSILALPLTIQATFNRLFRTFFIVVLFYFFYKAADCVAILFGNFVNKSEKKVSPVLTGLFRKSLKVVIIIIEIFMIIKEWGFDVTGLITGLGIGGLAISLAAKDAASNFLGSVTIMADKTYDIGDWIQTDSVEGFVEEIGFRSTKIRTFSNALTIVPNSILSNEPVTNWTKMGKRRVSFNLNIPINTPSEKITDLLNRIRDLLENHEGVNQDYKVVQLNGFEDASLKVLVYYFTKTTAYLNYLEVSEDINIKIIKIFEEVGVKILPPRRILVAGETRDGSVSHSDETGNGYVPHK